ncbi:MAG: cation-translocating P-type ATPase [Candidatus Thermoplasmatota archaeon]|nr:cation-translocating P-type ATPase [Candidatus Thermoplasmatota archaeon]
MSPSDDSDDFILIDGDSDSSPPVEKEIPTSTKSSEKVESTNIRQRLKSIATGVSEQVEAVKDRLKPRMSTDAIGDDAEAPPPADLTFSLDGSYSFEWPIRGMDCPDCAAKASRAVNRLPGVQKSVISATMGTANITFELGAVSLSKVGSVLANLGHEADLPWQKLSGVSATGLMNKHGVSRKELMQLFTNIPGVLDVRFEDASIQLQIVLETSSEVRGEMYTALEQLVGGSVSMQEISETRLNSSQWRLVLTIPAIAILVTILAMKDLNESVLLSITLLGVGLSGWRMFAEAWAGIRNQELGFQLLTSLAVIGALFGQAWSEALIVSILVAIASHMEEAALRKAREAMQGGLNRLPRQARLTTPAKSIASKAIGTITTSVEKFTSNLAPLQKNLPSEPDCDDGMVPIDTLNIGDFVEIRSGEIVPVDGLVIEGIGSLNRAPLTGESIPIRIDVGDTVHAGLVLDRGPIVVEATAIGEDTLLSGLIDEVRTYREVPPRIQGTVERFSQVWVPFVLVGAVFAGLVMNDYRIMLLLWVVACPCALLLAAPVPHAAALSTASRSGIIARGGDALEAASRIDLALLDKTGTLTSGHPRLDQILLVDGIERKHALRLAAGIEARSNHPYAAAIINLAEKESAPPLSVTKLTDGRAGVEGSLKGKSVCFGRPDWLDEQGINIPSELIIDVPEGHGFSVLSEDGKAIAAFTFIHDDLREGAAEMIHDLRTMGVAVELLSGDAQSAVEALGREVGVAAGHCRGEIDPKGKAVWVERRSQGRHTLMAGDGFNDAAALAVADLGIAVGSGEQVNLDAADVLIPGEDPRSIANFVQLSRRTRSIIQTNVFISIAVTAILILSVLTKWQTNLWVGVAIHEASAFLVILNGAFVAASGNRFQLLLEIFGDLFRDYADAMKMLISKPDSSSV